MADHITIEPAEGTIVIRAGGAVVAESPNALALREGDYPAVFYLPREDVGMEFFDRSDKVTHCPHKGDAAHFHMVTKSTTIEDAAWSYEDPIEGMEQIKGHLAFYADRMTIETL